MPVPLTGRDYLELLPVRWQAITPAGISIHHRTYDADLLAPHRGQASPVAGRGGKWEIHYNPTTCARSGPASRRRTHRDSVDPPRPRPPALRRTHLASHPHPGRRRQPR
ncbi:hypothetical protein ACFQ60_46925 [Streptomyces zhihengii]